MTVIDRQPGPAQRDPPSARPTPGRFLPAIGALGARRDCRWKAIKWMFQRHAPLAESVAGGTRSVTVGGCSTDAALTATPATILWRTSAVWFLAEYKPDLPARCCRATPTGIRVLKGARAGRCSCSVPPNSIKCHLATLAVLEDAGVPYRAAGSEASVGGGGASALAEVGVATSGPAACVCQMMKPANLSAVYHPVWRRWRNLATRRRDLPLQPPQWMRAAA